MKLVFYIVKGIITVFLAMILLLVIFQKVTNNKLALGNLYIFQVASESMTPEYRVGDIIFVQKVKPNTIKVGDDVTYLGRKSNLAGLTITHRVVRTRQDNGKYYYVTKGTANEYEDPEISQNDIYGKVTYHSILFSFVGRLMTNIYIYYILFIGVGVAFAFELISRFVLKKD